MVGGSLGRVRGEFEKKIQKMRQTVRDVTGQVSGKVDIRKKRENSQKICSLFNRPRSFLNASFRPRTPSFV